jgi:hypothetical protein
LFLVLYTVSILIKPLGLVFLPLLLARRHFVSVAIVLLGVVVTAVPYFALDPQGWEAFWRVNMEAVPAKGFVIHAGNQGLHALVVTLCTRLSGIPTASLASFDELPGLCRAVLGGLPILVVIVSGLATWKLRERAEALVFIWSATYVLGYKDVWEHSYPFVILGLVCLWVSGCVSRKVVLVCAAGLALPTAFVLYDAALPAGPFDPEHEWGLVTAAVHHASKPLWVIILYAACVVQALRGGAAGVDRAD